MIKLWEPAVGPLLEAAAPRVIVEIGTWNGETTAKLLELAAGRDATVHTIDPSPGPKFDASDFERRHGGRLVFHRATSLEALPQIEGVDAVLIDGDHNWYTVYNELKVLAAKAEEDGRDFPLILLHDVDWPYGRRDLYYNPETIPEEYRRPVQGGRAAPDDTTLFDRELSPELSSARSEDTARSGVRTAVEDFVAEAGFPLRFQSVIGFNGLGILASERRLAGNADLRRVLEELESPAWLREQCARIESVRLRVVSRLVETRRALSAATSAKADENASASDPVTRERAES